MACLSLAHAIAQNFIDYLDYLLFYLLPGIELYASSQWYC